ncbi:MAG: hypothetical protein LQ342_004448, partial [Letrouitia transgressa]
MNDGFPQSKETIEDMKKEDLSDIISLLRHVLNLHERIDFQEDCFEDKIANIQNLVSAYHTKHEDKETLLKYTLSRLSRDQERTERYNSALKEQVGSQDLKMEIVEKKMETAKKQLEIVERKLKEEKDLNSKLLKAVEDRIDNLEFWTD